MSRVFPNRRILRTRTEQKQSAQTRAIGDDDRNKPNPPDQHESTNRSSEGQMTRGETEEKRCKESGLEARIKDRKGIPTAGRMSWQWVYCSSGAGYSRRVTKERLWSGVEAF